MTDAHMLQVQRPSRPWNKYTSPSSDKESLSSIYISLNARTQLMPDVQVLQVHTDMDATQRHTLMNSTKINCIGRTFLMKDVHTLQVHKNTRTHALTYMVTMRMSFLQQTYIHVCEQGGKEKYRKRSSESPGFWEHTKHTDAHICEKLIWESKARSAPSGCGEQQSTWSLIIV